MKRDLSQLDRSSRTVPCDLCAGSEFAIVSRHDRRRRPLVTVVCARCGLVSHDRIPGDDELADFYGRTYRVEYHGEHTPSARRVVREWQRGEELVRRLAWRIPPGGRVLEIGSGIGCTVKQFALAGFDASGIEPGAGFQSYSRDVLGARVARLSLEQLRADSSYDLVLLVHVLEHLPSPRGALSRIRQLLDPGRQLYVEVPNLAAPHAAPHRLFHYAHIYNFTAATLAGLGAQCGYAVQTLSSDGDRNLRVLMTAAEARGPEAWPDASGQRTLQALDRFNTWTYHLRWSYVADRTATLWRHAAQRMGAERRRRRILDQCHAQAVAPGTSRSAA